jgi:CBS domain containing-hemolysin-like protein
MTPMDDLITYDQNKTVKDIFSPDKDIPVGRLQVYSEYSENLVGIDLRRDVLLAFANNQTSVQLRDIMHPPKIIGGEVLVDLALDEFLTEAPNWHL